MFKSMARRFLLHLFLILFICSGLAVQVKVSYGEEDDAEEVFVDQSKIGWVQTNGPPGGKILKLIQNPQRHNELFVLSENGNIYKSIDKGESWDLLDELKNIQVSAMAVYEDKLFLCGNGRVIQYDSAGNLTTLLAGSWNELFVPDGKVFVVRQGDRKTIGIMYSNLTSEAYDWKDVSPSESELTDLVPPPEEMGLNYGIMVRNLVIVDDRLLANIVMEVEGSGEHFNGYLYISGDLGTSWSKVDLNVQSGLIISNIIQDPHKKERLILAFKHRLENMKLPLSELLLESNDSGLTWSSITDLSMEANHVGDVDCVDSSYYVTLAEGSYIIKLNQTGYDLIDMPRAEGYDQKTVFTLIEVFFDLDTPQIVYGRSVELGLLKSEDGMKTWRKIDGDIISSNVSIVLTHPNNSNVMFTSGNTAHEAYFTKDGGEAWLPFSHITYGDELKIDPHDPNHIIFIDENSQIYESFDLGETWTYINYNFSSARVFDFEISDDGTIYVSNTGVGISKQAHGDIEWQYLLNSPDYVYDFEIDPEDSDILYAAYSPKIFENHSSIWRYLPNQTEQNGWSELFRIENTSGITSIRFDPSNSNRIYAGVIGIRGAIYVSNDRGMTWNILNEHFIMNTVWGQSQLIVDPNNPSIAYAATWLAGTWKTTDAGETWELLEDAPISSTALSLNLKNTNIIYLADRSSPTVWKSMDAGKTWNKIADFAGDGALLVMRVLADGDTVYASTFLPSLQGGRLYKSTDAGLTWSDSTGTLPKGVLDIAVNPTNSSILYVTTNIHGAYKSNDGGVTWMEMGNLPYVGAYDIEIDPNNPQLLYIAARGGSMPSWFTEIAGELDGIVFNDTAGVYKSTDGGLSWSKILITSASCRAIRRHPDNPNLLFAPDLVDGLLVSIDGGNTWTAVREGLDNAVVTSVAVDDDKIYVGTQGCGVYSGDLDIVTGKITWQPSRSNKPVPEVYSLQIEVDPTDSNTIFVGSNPGGLYVSTDGGITFKDRNAITPSVVVDDPLLQGYYTFTIDPSDPQRMWIGTWGKGIYKSYDAMLLDVPAGLFGKHIRKIVIDPSNPDNVYVATQEGIFVTRNEGETWENLNEGQQTLDILSLKIDRIEYAPFFDDFEDLDIEGWQVEEKYWSPIEDDGNMVLQGMGHHWATAGLESWRDYTFEFKVKLIQGEFHVNFRIQPDEGGYYLGFHTKGLYLGKQFNECSEFAVLADQAEAFNQDQWYNFKIKLNGNQINVYIDGELKLEYTDQAPLLYGAIGFESLDESQIYLDNVNVTIDSTSEVYAGTAGYGIYKFDYYNGEWKNLGRTLGTGWWHVWDRRMYQFCSIVFDPIIPEKLYLGVFPSGFFISEDNGHTWKDSSLGLGNDGMFSLTIHPDNPEILWAGTYNGLAKSIDGGKTWTLKSKGWPPEQWPYTVLIDDANPDIMYSTSKTGQNKGFCHRNTFCGVVMKTTDGGENWFYIMNGLDNRSEFYNILFHPLNHKILFMSTSKGVYMSTDAGNNWTGINNGLPTTENWVRDNVADNLALTADAKYLVLGIMEHGVWKADLNYATIINKIPIASFTYSPDEPITQDTISFYDSSEDPDGDITLWKWDFGDGSISNEQNPTHKYDAAAKYTVILTVTDNHGSSDNISKDLMIKLGQPSINPLIIITATGFGAIVILALIIIKKRR
jgi:photosystem II stability/assembly factor-like uncharacterized protein